MAIWQWTLVAWSLTFAVAPAVAANFYVNNRTGHDRFNGRSSIAQGTGLGPLRTVQAAIRRAQPGDVIILMPTGEPYNEPIVVPARSGLGRENYPLVIEGNGVELVGFRPVEPHHWDYTRGGVYRLRRPFQPTGVLGSLTGSIPRKSCDLWGQMPSLERGEYAFWAGHFYFRPAKPFDLESHQLLESRWASGIIIDRTSHVIVRNFRVRGFREDGIQIKGPSEGVRIERCMVSECGRAGFSATTNVSAEVVGSFLTNNVKLGVVAENYTNLDLNACAIAENGQAFRTDDTTKIVESGGEPEPLEPGPFFLPRTWDRPAPLDLQVPDEPKPVEP